MDLPLEELMSLRITSVAKKEQTLNDAAAAVYILTSEDLRRSGAGSIPEALRMVPGLHVARIDANKWAISARGFNDRFANKLLVMIDGRSVYTQLFSGVFWETMDVPFDLVERIEVIRGTGAVVWGSNAVNGIINIITKKAQDSPRVSVSAAIGSAERAGVRAIYSRELTGGAHLRTHGFYADRAKANSDPTLGVDDSWRTGHAGLRVDWGRSSSEHLTVLGDLFRLRISSDCYSPLLDLSRFS